jgi:hypothetical protein
MSVDLSCIKKTRTTLLVEAFWSGMVSELWGLPEAEVGALIFATSAVLAVFVTVIVRKEAFGAFYATLLLPVLMAVSILFDAEVLTPFEPGSVADAQWRVCAGGVITTAAGFLHSAIVAAHGSTERAGARSFFRARYQTRSNLIGDGIWTVALGLGVVTTATSQSTAQPDSQNCTNIGMPVRSICFHGAGYAGATIAIGCCFFAIAVAIVAAAKPMAESSG